MDGVHSLTATVGKGHSFQWEGVMSQAERWETGKSVGDVILIAWIILLEVSFIFLWWV